MDHSYHIVGANGQTYGPVPLDKMRAWVREGRVAADTQVFRTDQADWQPASELAELGLGSTQTPLAPASALVRVVPDRPAPLLP